MKEYTFTINSEELPVKDLIVIAVDAKGAAASAANEWGITGEFTVRNLSTKEVSRFRIDTYPCIEYKAAEIPLGTDDE